jgi:hypothetical protein
MKACALHVTFPWPPAIVALFAVSPNIELVPPPPINDIVLNKVVAEIVFPAPPAIVAQQAKYIPC